MAEVVDPPGYRPAHLRRLWAFGGTPGDHRRRRTRVGDATRLGNDINHGNLTQAAINAAGIGATLKVRAGVHR